MKIKNSVIFILSLISFCSVFTLHSCRSYQLDPEEQERLNGIAREQARLTEQGWTQLLENDYLYAEQSFSEALEMELHHGEATRGHALSQYVLLSNYEAFDELYNSIKEDPYSPYSVAAAAFMNERFYYDHSKYSSFVGLLNRICLRRDIPDWVMREYQGYLYDYYQNRMGDYSAARAIKSRLDPLDNWTILGPYSNVSRSGHERDFLNISQLDENSYPFEDYPAGINNWDITPYNPSRTSGYLEVPMNNYFSNINYSSVYAVTQVDLRNTGQYQLVVSRKGAVQLWVDNQLILSDAEYSQGRNQFYHNITLEEGPHRILVKISNLEDSSHFSVSLTQVEGLEYVPTALYRELFPQEDHFDPFINELCRAVEEDESDEAEFWLFYGLLNKGWSNQAMDLAQSQLNEFPESQIWRWAHGLVLEQIGDFSRFESLMTQIAQEGQAFSPAYRFVLLNYWQRNREMLAWEWVERIMGMAPEWYYVHQARLKMTLNTREQQNAEKYYREMLKLFPYCAEPDILMLENKQRNSPEETTAYLSRIQSLGLHRLGILQNYFYQLWGGDISSAMTTLQNYLYHYSIEPFLWTELMNLEVENNVGSLEEMRNRISGLIADFPLAEDLWQMELEQSRFLYQELKWEQDQGTILPLPMISMLNRERGNYERAMEKLLELYPESIYLRDEYREYLKLPIITEQFLGWDPYEHIEEYQQEGLDWSGADAVWVYDYWREIYHSDGGANFFIRSVKQVLTAQGVEENRYHHLEFHPTFGNGQIKAAFIVKSDGTRIEADLEGRTLAFPGLAPGDFIVYEYHTEYYMPGSINRDFWTYTYLDSFYPIHHREFHLCYPEGQAPNIAYHNIEEDQVNLEEGEYLQDFTQLSIIIEDQEAAEMAYSSAEPRDCLGWIDFSTLEDWDAISRWYEDLYQGQCIASYSIEEKADELCMGLESPIEKVKALYDFVAGSIEYEDLSFQYSNFIPQTADSVLREGYGDCKDQSILLISMLRSQGIDARVVLNTPFYRGENPYLPSPRFTHAIVEVSLEEGPVYLDPTANYSSYSNLSPHLAGSYILPIGEGEELRQLAVSTDQQRSYYLNEVYLGEFSTRFQGIYVLQGERGQASRFLYQDMDKDDQLYRFNLYMNSWLPGFSAEELETFNMDSLNNNPRMVFTGSGPSLIQNIRGRLVQLNIPWQEELPGNINAWIAPANNEQELHQELYNSGMETPVSESWLIHLPLGYQLYELPESRSFQWENCRVNYSYESQGNTILCSREFYLPSQIIPAEQTGKFRDFLNDVLTYPEGSIFMQNYLD